MLIPTFLTLNISSLSQQNSIRGRHYCAKQTSHSWASFALCPWPPFPSLIISRRHRRPWNTLVTVFPELLFIAEISSDDLLSWMDPCLSTCNSYLNDFHIWLTSWKPAIHRISSAPHTYRIMSYGVVLIWLLLKSIPPPSSLHPTIILHTIELRNCNFLPLE